MIFWLVLGDFGLGLLEFCWVDFGSRIDFGMGLVAG